jgi:two-component system cell cycle response regulator
MSNEPILVVEDNPVNVKLFRVLLEKAGFDVRTAGDANEALAALSDFEPRLILMDVQLPGIDGLELTRRLKANSRYKHIPVVALTAYAMKADQERAADAGCSGHIAKPIETRTFVESVRRYLETVAVSATAKEPQRKLILVADDDPAQRRLLEIHLTQLGFEVVAAKDGAEAIELMHDRRPDLVVTDILMPRLDGFRLTQYIRRDSDLSSVPVVLMTSGAIRPDDEQMALNMGANSLAARTQDLQEIVRAVRAALNEGAPAAARPDQELIEELRKRFVEDGIRESCELLDNLLCGFNPDAAKKATHRWAGSGGTFGLPQVSQAAFELESLLAQPDADLHAVGARLAHIKDLFSAAAQAEEADISEAVAASLSGKRFAAIGFDEVEAMRLGETLEKAHAVLRVRYAVPATNESWTHLYDGVIVSIADAAQSQIDSAFLASIDKPLLAIGLSSSVLETALNAHNGEHDFLLRPWNPSELVLRCYTVLSRAASRAVRSEQNRASRPHVLIGDDDPTTVALVRMTLKNNDVECQGVFDGSQVLDAVAENRPDLVVLDINMPQLDGFEVLTALKNGDTTRDIPVVMLTARQQEADILRGFSLGADDYVTKPFNPLELVARIKRSLRKTA